METARRYTLQFERFYKPLPISNGVKIIAFITNHSETRKILKHINEETARPPPLAPLLKINVLQEDFFVDYIPPVEEYFQDQKFIN